MKDIVMILILIIMFFFALGSFWAAEAERKERKQKEKELEKERAKNEAMQKANEIKADAHTGNHGNDLDFMAGKLHDYAKGGKV